MMRRMPSGESGRGPTRATGHFVGENALLVVLENALLPAAANAALMAMMLDGALAVCIWGHARPGAVRPVKVWSAARTGNHSL